MMTSSVPKTNSHGLPLGPRGYVICKEDGCEIEITDLSREISLDYARCHSHREAYRRRGHQEPVVSGSKREGRTVSKSYNLEEGVMAKEKAVRQAQPISWFREKAEKTQNVEVIRRAALDKGYRPSTISVQLGRLRQAGLLPKPEPGEKKDKATKTVKAKPKKEVKADGKKEVKKNFLPQPKPSKRKLTKEVAVQAVA